MQGGATAQCLAVVRCSNGRQRTKAGSREGDSH